MKNAFRIFSLLFLVNFSLSCNDNLYIPVNEVIDPANKVKQIKVTAASNSMSYFRPQVGISYSPINKFNITYNNFYSYAQKSNSLVVGYYHNIYEEDKTKINSTLEFNVGYGLGSNRTASGYDFDFDQTTYKGDYQKLFLQLGFLKSIKSFEIKLNLRSVFLDWSKLTLIIDQSNNLGEYTNYLENIKLEDPYKFQEASIKISANKNALKLFTTVIFRLPTKSHVIEFASFNAAVGATVNLNEIYSLNKSK